MKIRTVLLSTVAVLAMVILTACGGVGLSNFNLSPTQTAPNAPAVTAPTQTSPLPVQPAGPAGSGADLLSAYQGTLEEIYTAVSPSVVNIQVVEQVTTSGSDSNSIPGFPFGLPQGQGSTASAAVPKRVGLRVCVGPAGAYRDQ